MLDIIVEYYFTKCVCVCVCYMHIASRMNVMDRANYSTGDKIILNSEHAFSKSPRFSPLCSFRRHSIHFLVLLLFLVRLFLLPRGIFGLELVGVHSFRNMWKS